MRGIQSYKRSAVEGASNEDLLLLYMDAVVRRVEAADAAMERGDRKGWQAEIHVARAIFVELRTHLDPTLIPDIARSLDETYRWCIHHLSYCGRTGDRGRLAEVRRVTGVIHTTWTEAVRAAQTERAQGIVPRGSTP